jgi:CSLREA domain-containing protein
MMSRYTSVLLFLVAIGGFPARADAATWIVNSTADAGDANVGDGACATASNVCTLRAAIQEANALAGHDTIEFAIGSGLQTINAASNMPTISSPVTIDGTTQPGFAGSPIIVVDGGGSRRSFVVTAGGSTLRGLVLASFAGDGLTLRDNGGNVVETTYVGMAADGTTAAGNSASGIVLENSSNNRIGGPSIAQRCLISGNTGKGAGGGILIEGGSGNVIQGNFIGTDITGMVDHGNQGRGIALSGSSNNLIGGSEPGAGNLISGNRATGVRLLGGSDNNVIEANYIGINRTGTVFLKNDRGVQLRTSNGNTVQRNIIAGNVYDGVLIWEGASNNLIFANVIAGNGQGPIGDPTEAEWNGVLVHSGTGNSILSNQIYGNREMGIELGDALGVTPNDAGDGDAGANNFQNFPVLTAATKSGGTIVVSGTLNSTASASFIVQLFGTSVCDATGHGEGAVFLGSINVTTNASGNGAFSVPVGAQNVQVGWNVTSTATGPGASTSEFSACMAVR